MKKTLISLATASLIASTAMAADKGVDFTTTGQAVLYYQTNDNVDLLSHGSSRASVGVQLNLGSDLGNGFTFGSQFSYLGTAGLEKNLVSNTMQDAGQKLGMDGINDEIALTKMFIAKQIGNTTVKIGRQELPKSLSPLAFTEGWNVFKNTFEAVLIVNSDIPDTTLVAAYVGQSNDSIGGSLDQFDSLKASAGQATADVSGTAYMLTAQNKSLPMTTITASYYTVQQVLTEHLGALPSTDADALWIDVKVKGKELPMGLCVGVQAGSIMPEEAPFEDTSAFGLKVSAKPMDALSLTAAYSSVDEGSVGIVNMGTGVKTPLYTQMVFNQDFISTDADTIMLKGAYSLGDAGTVILQGSQSSAGVSARDYTDLELLYKVKAGGVNFLAAFLNTTVDNADAVNTVRVWARYAF